MIAYSNFPSLVRFFPFTEIIDDAVNRTDVTDVIAGAALSNIALAKSQPCSDNTFIYRRATPVNDGAFFLVDKWLVDADLGNCLQPDLSGGADMSATDEFPNLGSDDFLFLVSGHSLTNNATGTKVGFGNIAGDGSNVSYIIAAANASGNGVPTADSVPCVKDTLGNVVEFTALGQPWGFTQGDPDGSLVPYMWAIYRKDGLITRRIVQRHNGIEDKESVSDAALTGDIHPNQGWLWYDQITFGAALFHWPDGAPNDIDQACDWMAADWEDNFDNKSIWPSWAEGIDMKFSDAGLKATEMTGTENMGAGDAGSDIQLNPSRLRDFANRSDVRIKHWWKCDEAAGATLVDSIAGADITVASGISGNVNGYVQFTAPDLTTLPVGGAGLWQPGNSSFLFLAVIKQSRPQFTSAAIGLGDSSLIANQQIIIGANVVPSIVRGDAAVATMQKLNASGDGSKFSVALSRDGGLVRQWGQVYKTDSVPAEFLDSIGEIVVAQSVTNVGSINAMADVVMLATAECAGMMIIEFPYGIPLDVDHAIRQMGGWWGSGNKQFWPSWNVIA